MVEERILTDGVVTVEKKQGNDGVIFRIYIADFETVSNGSQRNAYPFHGVAADILNDMGNLFRVVNGKAKAGAPVEHIDMVHFGQVCMLPNGYSSVFVGGRTG